MHDVQNYVYVYFNLYIIRQQTEIQKILCQMVTIVHHVYSVLNVPVVSSKFNRNPRNSLAEETCARGRWTDRPFLTTVCSFYVGRILLVKKRVQKKNLIKITISHIFVKHPS